MLKFIYNEKESHYAKAMWDKGKRGNHMKQKIFLTSIAAIMLVTPSFATVGETNFETNQTDVSSCEIDVLGVDENTANANAQWSVNTYSCPAGTYLPDGDTWSSDNQYSNNNCAVCPAGSYCAGSGSTPFTYSEATDQGITACPSGYSNSSAHSSAESSCYRTCAASDVANLKSGGTVSGRYYSGNNNQCEPANDQQCAGGYHYVAGVPDLWFIDQNAIHSVDFLDGRLVVNISGNYEDVSGTLVFLSQCSTQSGTAIDGANVTTLSTLPDSAGQYCWCQLFRYRVTIGGVNTDYTTPGPWVSIKDMNSASSCASGCLTLCGNVIFGDNNNFTDPALARERLLRSNNPAPASCTANTITLNWKDATGGTHATTQCTYGGTIDTPTTAPTKRGYTFTGWRFVAPSGN